MSTSIYKVEIEHISKTYKMYENQIDRFKEAFNPKRKSYHTDFAALTDVSFKVKGGEILGIIGKNGSGKSTLLKIITGVLTPTTGTVKVDGRISSLLELGTGFNMEYSGIENIFFYCTIMGLSNDEIKERLDDIIDFADIGDHINQPVKTYSSGMFARLAFACAINVDPDVLIVDEILSVGDIKFQAKSFNKFKEFKERGVTIIYVGHDLGVVRNFCDRVIWMNAGKIVEEGDPLYITAQYTEFMYTGASDMLSEEQETEKVSQDCQQKENSEEEMLTKEEILKRAREKNEPISHWGSCIGLVEEVRLLDKTGKEILYTDVAEPVCIEVAFKDDSTLDYDHMSVAISIKNNDGTDLLVCSTADQNLRFSKGKKRHKVTFCIDHRLARGEYILVVALEDRANAAIAYYEYIEGVKYIKNYAPDTVFGVFAPECEMILEK